MAEIRIALADTGEIVPPGETGEIVARGPMTPLCYVGDPQLDARYRTSPAHSHAGPPARVELFATGYRGPLAPLPANTRTEPRRRSFDSGGRRRGGNRVGVLGRRAEWRSSAALQGQARVAPRYDAAVDAGGVVSRPTGSGGESQRQLTHRADEDHRA